MKDFIAHRKIGVDKIPLKHEIMVYSDEKKAFRLFEAGGNFVYFRADLTRKYHLTVQAPSRFQAQYCSPECID